MIPDLAEDYTFDKQPDNRMHGPAVLVVDDEEDQRARIELICEQIGQGTPIQVQSVSSLNEALSALASRTFHVVLLDTNLGTGNEQVTSGIDAIGEMLYLQPHLQILMISGDDTVNDVVTAMRAGAFGYVSKKDDDSLIQLHVEKTLHVARLTQDKIRNEHNAFLKSQNFAFGGTSETTKQLLRKLKAVAKSDEAVLLIGESGSGKTHAAKLIHNLRAHYLQQAGRPWVELNIGAVPTALAESILFGHEKGAFTGANDRKQGVVEHANGGTLFLDEIGDINPETAVKLLKVIEGAPFTRVGGEKKPLYSHFKLITATHRDLESMVRERNLSGRFLFKDFDL